MNWNRFFCDYVNGKFDHVRPGDPEYDVFSNFYEVIKKAAASVLAGKKGTALHLTADDLANEFLLNVREKRNTLLNGQGGVKMHMARLLANTNQASRELFGIARQALKGLKTEVRAFERSGPSLREDLWWSPDSAGGTPPCLDEEADTRYREALADIEPLPPPANEGRRLVSPRRAKAFAFGLLQAVKCPLPVRLVHDAFCQKAGVLVVTTVSGRPGGTSEEQDDDSDVGEREDSAPFSYTEKMLLEQIQIRGGEIGERLCREDLCTAYVQYYYPKNVEGRKVTLSQVGNFRRLSEKSLKISKILTALLPDFHWLKKDELAEQAVSLREVESHKLQLTPEERIVFGLLKHRLLLEALEVAHLGCQSGCQSGSRSAKTGGVRAKNAAPRREVSEK